MNLADELRSITENCIEIHNRDFETYFSSVIKPILIEAAERGEYGVELSIDDHEDIMKILTKYKKFIRGVIEKHGLSYCISDMIEVTSITISWLN